MLLMKAPSVSSERDVFVLSWIHTSQHMRQEKSYQHSGTSKGIGDNFNRSNERIYMSSSYMSREMRGSIVRTDEVISLKVKGDHVQDTNNKNWELP